MQSGKIKHWNQDKGFGFIDVDNQSEDVFFYASNATLSQSITVGQRVYFESKRNNKNQLRATKVTSNAAHSTSKQSNRTIERSGQNNHKTGWLSTVFSILGLLAIVYFGFSELKPKLFPNDIQSTSTSSIGANVQAITGDAQIDNTIMLIRQGGPFPYPDKDGTTFYNREGRLPAQSQGYYREYTVPTIGTSNRGARRIITGGYPPTVYYFTADHYNSFTTLNVASK